MTWVRIDDHFADHPKVLQAGPIAGWMHVAALCYTARHLTDGFIPSAALPTLASFDGVGLTRDGQLISTPMRVEPTEIAAVLVKVGLWREKQGGYAIHDYLEYNPSRADVESERHARQAGGKARAASGKRKQGRFVPAGDQQAAGAVLVDMSPAEHQPRTPSPSPTPSPENEVRGTAAQARPALDEERRPRKDLTPAQETRMIQKGVVERWLKLRNKHVGTARYTDAGALKGLRREVERAIVAGCTAGDILDGIERHAGDPKSNPWYASEWANLARADREERLSQQRHLDDRRAADQARELQRQAERRALEERYPGKSLREMLELEAERQRGGLRPVGGAIAHVQQSLSEAS